MSHGYSDIKDSCRHRLALRVMIATVKTHSLKDSGTAYHRKSVQIC